MVDLRVATINGSDRVLTETAIERLIAKLRGPLLCSGDSGYDETQSLERDD